GRVDAAGSAAADAEWQFPSPNAAIPYSREISFAWLGRDAEGMFGDDLMARIVDARRGHFLREPLSEQNFLLGEEARAGGIWAEPENWGTWLCRTSGELALGLALDDSREYYVFLRLRASGPVSDLSVRLLANGERAWEGSIGTKPKDIVLRVRRRAPGSAGWRLRIRAETELSS